MPDAPMPIRSRFQARGLTMPLPPSFACAHAPPPQRARLAQIAAAVVALAVAACASVPSRAPTDRSATGTFSTPVTELQYIDVGMGAGAEALPGMFIVLNYTGWLYDPFAPGYRGAKFDSSLDRDAAYGFFLDTGKVIKGWDEGVPGMKIGGRRTLAVPPGMAYGAGGSNVIPPNATLLFDIELLDVRLTRGGGEK
jgi:FKBP-type peptidyl-prolyl cis-trans isomerase